MGDRLTNSHCEYCSAALPPSSRSDRRFCNGTHRKAAQRLRRNRASAGAADMPADADQAGAVEAYLVGRTAPPDEQVISAVHEAVLLAGVFMRLSIEARPQFAWRCAEMAAALNDALCRLFEVKS